MLGEELMEPRSMELVKQFEGDGVLVGFLEVPPGYKLVHAQLYDTAAIVDWQGAAVDNFGGSAVVRIGLEKI